MRESCLYCGERLLPYHHWGLCPKCEPDFIKKVQGPSLADRIQERVGGLLREKGRPYINGVKK